MKTLFLTIPAGTIEYEITDVIEVFDYDSPKGFIFSSTDYRDYVYIMRYQSELAEFDYVTNGSGEFQLNKDNKDVTLFLPDVYGVLPNTPTFGDIKIWVTPEIVEEPFVYSLDFSDSRNSFYLGAI